MQSIRSQLLGFKHRAQAELQKLGTQRYIPYAVIATILIILTWLLFRYGLPTGLESLAATLGFRSDPGNLIAPKVERPFLNIMTNTGKNTNIIFITHHFSRENCMEFYKKYKAMGCVFLGMSSYCEFPGRISNPFDVMHDPKHLAYTYDYFKLTDGWCHCFRNPDKYIPPAFPKLLMSESDFAKYEKHVPKPDVKKEYDFIYICLKDNDKCEDGWQSYNRNWEDAQKWLGVMCNKFHLRGLLIGRVNCKLPSGCHQLMEPTDKLPYSEFIAQYAKCRFIFVPNKLDASPRVITEAMCFGLPVLCNYNITGGWKYVTPETGELFNKTPDDFEAVVGRFLNNFSNYKPREYFVREYAVERVGKQLLDFAVSVFGWDRLNIKPEDNVSYIYPGVGAVTSSTDKQ